MSIRPIFIIDCFAQTERLEEKLHERVRLLKEKGADVMLISNTPVGKETISLLNYYVYDAENHLFNEDLKAVDIKLFHSIGNITFYEVLTGVQRHGLSVMRNLFKSLKILREYGYTHFHRLEVDDIMGEQSLKNMFSVPELVERNGKKGMFFFNDNDRESNISFHYMYCEINHFLTNVMNIETQEDYMCYLREEMQTDNFRNVEEFVRNNLNVNSHRLITYNGSDMNNHFPDTIWNTEISQSNLSHRFRGCTTRIYRVLHEGREQMDHWMVITYNYSDKMKRRSIELITDGRVVGELNHQAESLGFWACNKVPRGVDTIRVMEGMEELYTESVWNMHPEQIVVIN
jgi:hypothetical protein